MIEVPQASFDSMGIRWSPMSVQGRKSAALWCPNNHFGTLEDHTIAADGSVSPSVVCPSDRCPFHDQVRLVGWRE